MLQFCDKAARLSASGATVGEMSGWSIATMATLPLHLGRLISWIIRHRKGITWAVMLFPLLFIGFMAAGKLLVPSFYRTLIAENNVVDPARLAAANRESMGPPS